MLPTENTSSFRNCNKLGENSSSNDFLNDSTSIKVREYINPAVYVETTYKMNSCKQAIYIPGSGDHPKTVKRCVCFTNPKECPCHPHTDVNEDAEVSQTQTLENLTSKSSLSTLSYKSEQVPSKTESSYLSEQEFGELKELPDEVSVEQHRHIHQNYLGASYSAVKLTSNAIPVFESDSGITVKATNSTSDLRLSIPSMSSITTVRFADDHSRDENFRQWCIRKDAERKLQEEREILIQKIKEQQKQAVVELERENFKKWLMVKKKQEEVAKKRKQHEQELDKIKMDEKEKRMEENQLNFQLWLKRKEEQDLEKKIKLQMTLIQREEQKQQRNEYSQKAYEIWKQHAKNRQKPVPFGLGIDTLKSSSSVAYINPQPWVPNIDVNVKDKPHSQ